jgi:hypothetical protein
MDPDSLGIRKSFECLQADHRHSGRGQNQPKIYILFLFIIKSLKIKSKKTCSVGNFPAKKNGLFRAQLNLPDIMTE